jgi:hypothetical protein
MLLDTGCFAVTILQGAKGCFQDCLRTAAAIYNNIHAPPPGIHAVVRLPFARLYVSAVLVDVAKARSTFAAYTIMHQNTCLVNL